MAHRSRRASRALAQLPETDPSLAALALWCEMEDGHEPLTTTSCDINTIGTAFEGLPLREQIGVLGHHVLHVALRHEARALALKARLGAAFDDTLYNLCADALINSCLIAAEHALPRPAVTLPDLTKAIEPVEAAHFSLWDVETLYMALAEQDRTGTGNTEKYMQQKRFARDLIARGTQETAQAKSAEWAAHLKRAQQSAGAAGRGIGSALRRLSSVSASATPWEVLLRGIVARALLPDPRLSYKRPRSAWVAAEAHARANGLPQPVFDPKLERLRYHPRIVLGVDTSGSIGQQTLRLFASGILGVVRRERAELHILCFDEVVYSVQKITLRESRNTLAKIDFRRDGGTSFEDLFVQTAALDPSVLIVLTDLKAPLPQAPEIPFIWAVHGTNAVQPAYGKLVDIRG